MAGEEGLMKQVEELKRKLREAEEEREEIRRGRKEAWTTTIDNFIFLVNNNSTVDTDDITSGLRGGMGSCRHMAVGRRYGNRISSSYYSLTIPFIMHSPNAGSGGHLFVALTLLGGTKRNRHPRPTLRWAACTSASGAEDLGIWLRSVPLHSGLNVLAIAVVSMATATTTASQQVPHTRSC